MAVSQVKPGIVGKRILRAVARHLVGCHTVQQIGSVERVPGMIVLQTEFRTYSQRIVFVKLIVHLYIETVVEVFHLRLRKFFVCHARQRRVEKLTLHLLFGIVFRLIEEIASRKLHLTPLVHIVQAGTVGRSHTAKLSDHKVGSRRTTAAATAISATTSLLAATTAA